MASNKLVAGILAGTLLLMPLFTAAEASIESDQQRLDEIRQQYNQSLQQINKLRSEEKDLNKKLAAINQQIAELDQQISGIQAELNAGAEKIRQMEIEIQKTKEKLEARKKMLMQRLRVLYEDGNVSYLEVLFQSTDFSDFIGRVSTLTLVVNQDKVLMEGIKKDKQKLDDTQAQLKQEQAMRQVRQDALVAAKAEQDKIKAEQQKVLAQVQKDRQITEAQAQQEEKEIQAIEAQIAAAIAAARQRDGGANVTSAGSWTWPVPSSHVISSGYGMRWGAMHAGIDIAAPLGTPIVAVDNGVVRFAGTASGFGHWVVIEHQGGVMSVYGHMYGDGIYVSVGQQVKRGQTIAAIGSDGESTGPHLHFSVATGISGSRMIYVDPNPYLGQ
ncbi:murein hydrolase activator EnvC family protein [Effusibacillus dendaii]|uniref:Peptidase M23 n=1 Tax=Effusibacillus dendaii TaxID=2743772 RepID=A0A7I8DDY9_9BACL|nr:M23 family metallopeptidase [Effusibacillus dendaii]BCJ87169.1 peptidase M23 [Effusibacillus dendaii]